MTGYAARLPGRFHRAKPAGVAGVDRPKLLSDTHGFERVGIVVALAIGGLILGHLVRYIWVAVYYDILEPGGGVAYAYPHITAWWHQAISVSWERHLVRFGIEGLYTGAVVQLIFYGIKRWPPEPASWWTNYVKRFLLVPSDALPEQTLWCLILAPLWIVVWALPWGIAIAWLLDVTHNGNTSLTLNLSQFPWWTRGDVTLAAWQQPLVGFAVSFLGARHVIKGTAFHFQRLIIGERQDAGHATPAWWMRVFPYLKWRFEWAAARRKVWPAKDTRGWPHRVLIALVALGLLVLAYQGWHILTYLDWNWATPFLMK